MLSRVLIVPCGIEIIIFLPRIGRQRVLIVPCGIEIILSLLGNMVSYMS